VLGKKRTLEGDEVSGSTESNNGNLLAVAWRTIRSLRGISGRTGIDSHSSGPSLIKESLDVSVSDKSDSLVPPADSSTGATPSIAGTLLYPSSTDSGDTMGATDNIDNDSTLVEEVKNLVYGHDDALFGWIEEQQGAVPFGDFLDAGTGVHSLRWIATLCPPHTHGQKREPHHTVTHFTAVTADANMQRQVQAEVDALGIDQCGSVVIGNWFGSHNANVYGSSGKNPIPITIKSASTKPLFLPMKQYNTILCDYLIGAMDGFSPYRQDELIPLLVQNHLSNDGGRLYIVGLEPLPDHAPSNSLLPDKTLAAMQVVCDVRRTRDACILLAGHRCYREFPLSWIHRQVENLALQQLRKKSGDNSDDENNPSSASDNNGAPAFHLRVLQSQRFPILYRHATIVRQINVGRSKLPFFADPSLARAMKVSLDELERRSLETTSKLPGGKVSMGFDYVVTIEKTVLT
jgi:hypothetical protein